MKSSGSILRGHLRPIGARSPPFVLIGLVVVLGIVGFNYWNLSYEYDAIVKEISELQDHLRMAVLKKETADKQSDAYEKRFREVEQQLGKMKITAEQTQRNLNEMERKVNAKTQELTAVKAQMDSCLANNEKLNVEKSSADKMQQQMEAEKADLVKINEELHSVKLDLQSQMENMRNRLAMINAMNRVNDPFNNIVAKDSSAKQHPAQLGMLKPGSVAVQNKGLNGMEAHFGGPLMLNIPDDDPETQQRDVNERFKLVDNSIRNEANVLPLPANLPDPKTVNTVGGNGVIPVPDTIQRKTSDEKEK